MGSFMGLLGLSSPDSPMAAAAPAAAASTCLVIVIITHYVRYNTIIVH